jgi:long-chain acyl-CoA synthetase
VCELVLHSSIPDARHSFKAVTMGDAYKHGNKGREEWIVEIGSERPATSTVPSASKIFRHETAKDGFPTLEGISSLYELFTQSVKKFPGNKCLGHRPKLADGTVGPFVFKTYKEVADEVALIASGLKAVGTGPQSRIGVFGGNCPEWMITMQVGASQRTCCL